MVWGVQVRDQWFVKRVCFLQGSGFRVGRSDSSGVTACGVQVRDQWFVKMKPLAEPALEAVANGKLRIVPDRFEKVYNRWLHNIRVRYGLIDIN